MIKYFCCLVIILLVWPQFVLAREDYNFNKYIKPGQIEKIKLAKIPQTQTVLQFGAVSHHLPTALPLIADFYQHLVMSQGPRKLFFIIGPDHREACANKMVTTANNYQTPFGVARGSTEIEKYLNKAGVISDDFCFRGEHAIGAQAIMIKYYFPEAQIVPILLSSSMTEADINRLVKILSIYLDSATFVASVDYSHYLTQKQANRVDETTISLINNKQTNKLKLANVDSPASVNVLARLAKLNKSTKPMIISHGNSAQFTKATKSTTSYIQFFYKK